MLTPSEFVTRWQAEVEATSAFPDDEPLATAPAELLAGRPLSESARRLLTEAGLPKSCRPFLSFDDLSRGLQRLWDVLAPGQWQPDEKLGLEHYGLIGSDGSGNPICIDERNGRVVLIDHELLFDSDREQNLEMFVNSSVGQLAESLLAVSTLPSEARLAALVEIDRPAVAEGTFWFHEAEDLPEDDGDAYVAPARPWWKFW